jgi:hypothetical protein
MLFKFGRKIRITVGLVKEKNRYIAKRAFPTEPRKDIHPVEFDHSSSLLLRMSGVAIYTGGRGER